jgi:hypothetical protein
MLQLHDQTLAAISTNRVALSIQLRWPGSANSKFRNPVSRLFKNTTRPIFIAAGGVIA